MNAILKNSHHYWREKVRNFAEKNIQPVISEYDAREEFPADLIKKLGAETDIFGMHVPVAYGGKNTDYLSYIIAVEEIARIDSSIGASVVAHNSLGIGPILAYGTEKQKQAYLPRFCTGQELWSFAITEEAAGSDVSGVQTNAKIQDNHWVINGSKKYITNASSELSMGTTALVVTDQREGGRNALSTILVPRDASGFERKTMRNKFMWRAADNAELYFKDCRVPEENLLGEKGKGMRIALKILDAGRLSVAAMGLGLAQGAYEQALAYAKKRKQFGKPIASFQAISFKLADMALKIELARNTLYNACWLKDNGHSFNLQAAMAKLYTSEIAREVTDEAMQIFGGSSLFKDNPIERFYRDQRLLQIGEGTSEILRMVIAKNII